MVPKISKLAELRKTWLSSSEVPRCGIPHGIPSTFLSLVAAAVGAASQGCEMEHEPWLHGLDRVLEAAG